MTPQQLLDLAGQLLATSTADTRGRWPRVCAWLIRLSLETALDQYWERVLPEAALCPMRPQLLLLPSYADPGIAERARDAWTGPVPRAIITPTNLHPPQPNSEAGTQQSASSPATWQRDPGTTIRRAPDHSAGNGKPTAGAAAD